MSEDVVERDISKVRAAGKDEAEGRKLGMALLKGERHGQSTKRKISSTITAPLMARKREWWDTGRAG